MASVTQQKVPPLENGDRLSRDEFERRYDAMPGLKKAELIEGVVYVPSPVRVDQHAEPHFNMIGWLAHYRWSTPGGRRGSRQWPRRWTWPTCPSPTFASSSIPPGAVRRGSRTTITSRMPRAGRRDRGEQRQLRLDLQVQGLSAQRRARIPGLAGPGSGDRLVRPEWEEVRAAPARQVRPVSEQGLPRPLARPGGPDPRRYAGVQAALQQAWPAPSTPTSSRG